jgi:hypothetical protein
MAHDAESQASTAADGPGDSPASTVDAPDDFPSPQPSAAWPPPGLERIQGDIWGVLGHLAAGGVLFTLPLLVSLTVRQDFWSLGVFGDAWWILLITTFVGLAVLMNGYVELYRLLRRAARAVDKGYHRNTVFDVLADRRQDSGLLIQGLHAYSTLSLERRESLLRRRQLMAVLQLSAAIWLSSGFVVGVLLSARGILDEGGLAWWSLVPVAVPLLVAYGLRFAEATHTRRARRTFFRQPLSKDLEREEIDLWYGILGAREDAVAVPAGSPGGGGGLRLTANGSLVLPLLVLLGGVALMMVAALGPTLAEIAIPKFSSTQQKAARSVALADLRLTPDSSITAFEAGEALVALGGVNGAPTDRLSAAPVRTYETRFFPEPGPEGHGGPTGMRPERWATELMPQVAEGLDPEVLTYLEDIASHPALAELRTLAYAPDLDESALWISPLPPDARIFELPIPRFSGVREATYVQVGAATAAAARGRTDEADRMLREIISAGLLMGEHGNTLISNLIGFVVTNVGAEALVSLYAATGRSAEAAALRDELDTAVRVAEKAQVGLETSARTSLAGMPETVTDSIAIRGLRWEFFITLSSLGPCLNLNRSVFGLDEGFTAWVEEAREGLVMNQGDLELFELARRGWFGSYRAQDGGLPGRLAGLVLADAGPGSCASAFRDMR